MLNQKLLSLVVLTAFLVVGCSTTSQHDDLYNPFSASAEQGDKEIQVAINNLLDSNFFIHSEGAATLVRHGGDSIPHLAQILESERLVYDENVPVIQPVLTKIFQKLDVSKVVVYLNHSHPILRAKAVSRIGESGQITLLQKITPLTEDSASEVQEEALAAVGKLSALQNQTAYLMR